MAYQCARRGASSAAPRRRAPRPGNPASSQQECRARQSESTRRCAPSDRQMRPSARPRPIRRPASPDQPADGGQAMVSAVIDGDTVMLADGRQLRLAGIAAPKRPLDRPDDSPWPLADAARSALAGLVLGRSVQLSYGGATSDRYGRVVAQLRTAEGTWVEGALLRSGLARVSSTADNRARVGDMLALEGEARAAGSGL